MVNREVANVAPVNTVPAAQTVNEDTALVFSSANGNAITVSDADAGTINAMQVTLSVTNGVLTLGGVAGLSFSSGANGSATMTFTGTIASINTALNGLRFDPTADFNGAATLTLDTNDQGNTGAGGAQSDNDTVAITVNAVNDAPDPNRRQRSQSHGVGGLGLHFSGIRWRGLQPRWRHRRERANPHLPDHDPAFYDHVWQSVLGGWHHAGHVE